MIERIVMVKLNDEDANPETREELARISREVLPTIPGVVSADAGLPADPASLASWDLALHIRFEKIEDVQPYIVDPIHRDYVENTLNPKAACKKAWNFEKP